MANVLFVCLQNAGRSQMSQALFERAAAGADHAARSAGTAPPPSASTPRSSPSWPSWASTSPTAPRSS